MQGMLGTAGWAVNATYSLTEPTRIIIARVQVEPGDAGRALCAGGGVSPVRQQRRLPESERGADQWDALLAAFVLGVVAVSQRVAGLSSGGWW